MIKKYFNYLIITSISALSFLSCSQSEFDENYYNPEKSVNATLEGLFTGFLYNHSYESSNTVMPRYWNLRTFQIPMPGKYSQTAGYSNGNGMYEQSLAYTEQRWNYYYNTHISGYRLMEKKYQELSPEEKEGYLPFMEVAKIFLYDQSAQMVDLWGDIPFFESGKIVIESGKLSKAKFDSGSELYTFFISDLKRISDYLNKVEVSGDKKNKFGKNDILFQGDLEKWKRYANSLRLRLAMRVSYFNEEYAKGVASEILTQPGVYPVVSNVSENLFFKAEGSILRAIINKHEGGIRGGLLGQLAPGKMINEVMAPSEDPRLNVMFSKNKYGKFVGVYDDWNEVRQADSISNNYFSRVDTATFSRNDQFPGIILTAAEVSLFKAEAQERWGVGLGNAKDFYENGMKQSVEFYFYINSLNQNSDGTSYKPKTMPTETEMKKFINSVVVSYEGGKEAKLEKIATQQWINFGIIQAYHAWAETRRTDYPKLNFRQDDSSPITKRPPSRLLYPNLEKTLNKENYAAVASKDLIYERIFWDVK